MLTDGPRSPKNKPQTSLVLHPSLPSYLSPQPGLAGAVRQRIPRPPQAALPGFTEGAVALLQPRRVAQGHPGDGDGSISRGIPWGLSTGNNGDFMGFTVI